MGKTSLAKELLAQDPARNIWILDYLAEYHDVQDQRVILARDDLYGFCQAVWAGSDPSFKTLCVFDEIDLYGKNNEYIEFLYKFGRHKEIDLISISRRFYDLPVIVRALTNEFYCFQITEERDLKYLSNFISKEEIKEIIKLTFLEYKILAL